MKIKWAVPLWSVGAIELIGRLSTKSGQCHARPMVSFPATEPFDQYQIVLLCDRSTSV